MKTQKIVKTIKKENDAKVKIAEPKDSFLKIGIPQDIQDSLHHTTSAISKVFPLAVTIRRAIHLHPELSGFEHKTARYVFDQLTKIGYKPKYCCNKTGVTATLKNGAGKTVVLRADMDALPIEEQTGLPFSSVHKGVMHACGHDMHTAILVAAAQVLYNLQHLWQGRVVLLFQPSEECAPGGAMTMIDEGVFPVHADAVLGLHVNPEHPTGIVGLKSGADYAGVVDFDVVINVAGGHGAVPNSTVDPIVCTCAIIQQLQTIVSRESPAGEPSVITVGKLNAGSKNNIIPTQAIFGGTIRALSESHLDFLKNRLREVVLTIASSFKAKAEISFEKAYPPGYNDLSITLRAYEVLTNALGKDRVVMRTIPTMLAEDFAYFQKKAKGLYVHLGVRLVQKKSIPGIHTPYFNPDEQAMKTGIAVHTMLAMDILKNSKI